jgi:hypothetical protein
VAFKFLNVLVLNIAEKLLAGRNTNQAINQPINHIFYIEITYFHNHKGVPNDSHEN